MPKLVLIRHGQSSWNLENRFTGWWDVDMTAKGEAEAKAAGELMAAKGLDFDQTFVSLQTRAIKTLNIALEAMGRLWLPVEKDWRLNERHYGALQGKDKKQTLEQFGEEQFMIWRRSYDTPPPPLEDDSEFSQAGDPRYADLPPELLSLPQDSAPVTNWEQALRQWADQALARGQSNLLDSAVPAFERIMIETALKHTAGRRRDAAVLLGWGRNTLTRKIKELGMKVDGGDDDEGDEA